MDKFLIQGEKVSIRNKRLSDAEEDHVWRCDPELARLDGATPLRMGFDEYLRQFKQELGHENSWSRRFSIDLIDGKHIGNCMYYDVDFFRGSAELGILVGDRDHWSGGYGSEAVKLLLYHMFTEMPLKKVYLHTLDWNHRAQRAFEKCGFKIIRPVKRGGLDFFFMELKKERWAGLQQEEEDLVTKTKAKEKSAS
ncbi:MAG: GNAT family N-acetyltransferase [Chloroflexota bacterium]|nr:GNAT family N-acetyltransferase [Chloroflexota bacterium]